MATNEMNIIDIISTKISDANIDATAVLSGKKDAFRSLMKKFGKWCETDEAKALDSVMFPVKHYNFEKQTIRTELQPCNEQFMFSRFLGIDPYNAFTIVESAIEQDNSVLLAEYADAIDNGITILNGVYKPLLATASGAKLAVSAWVRVELRKLFAKFDRFGLKINGASMAPCKYFTRMGLCMSTTKSYESIYGKDIMCSDIEIIPDIYRENRNVSDGPILIPVDKKSDVKEGASSLRPIKGLGVHLIWDTFVSIVGDQEITDKWGNAFKLSDKRVMAFESAFKWIDICPDRQTYEEAMEGRHLRVAVYMNKHGWKHMAYQPTQTLDFNEEAICKLEAIGKNYLDNFTELENARKLVPPEAREAVAIYPELMKDAYIADALRTGYRKQKMILRGGALPNVGKFFAIAPDVVDLFKEGAGLKAGECCCWGLPEGELVMIRYPHTSAASFVRLNNRHIVNGVADDNIICMNNYDDSLRRLGGADYDGDKVLVILNEEVKEIVCNTLDKMGDLRMPDPLEGKAQKYRFTKETCEALVAKFFLGITQRSNIGSVSNKLTAAYAMLQEAYEIEDEDARVEAINYANAMIEYWQLMVEVTVDKEKHGDTYVKAPDRLKEFDKILPNYVKFAKLAKKIGTSEKLVVDASAYRERMACPLEKYSTYINANTVKADEFAPKVDGDFFYDRLMFDAEMPKMNRKVFHVGEPKRDEAGQIIRDKNGKPVEYVNYGIFDKIVFAKTEEIVAMAKKHGIATNSVAAMRKELIEDLITMYAEHYNCSKEGVYNRIVFYIFTMENSDCTMAYKRTFWQALHEYAEKALTERFGTAALSMDLDGVDEGNDEDFEEDMDI